MNRALRLSKSLVSILRHSDGNSFDLSLVSRFESTLNIDELHLWWSIMADPWNELLEEAFTDMCESKFAFNPKMIDYVWEAPPSAAPPQSASTVGSGNNTVQAGDNSNVVIGFLAKSFEKSTFKNKVYFVGGVLMILNFLIARAPADIFGNANSGFGQLRSLAELDHMARMLDWKNIGEHIPFLGIRQFIYALGWPSEGLGFYLSFFVFVFLYALGPFVMAIRGGMWLSAILKKYEENITIWYLWDLVYLFTLIFALTLTNQPGDVRGWALGPTQILSSLNIFPMIISLTCIAFSSLNRKGLSWTTGKKFL